MLREKATTGTSCSHLSVNGSFRIAFDAMGNVWLGSCANCGVGTGPQQGVTNTFNSTPTKD